MHPRLRSPLTYIVAVPLLTLVVYVAVYARYHLAPSPWLSDAVATRAVVRLRAALEGRDAAALSDARVLPGPLPPTPLLIVERPQPGASRPLGPSSAAWSSRADAEASWKLLRRAPRKRAG